MAATLGCSRTCVLTSGRAHVLGVPRHTLPVNVASPRLRLAVCRALDRDPFSGDSFFTREFAMMDRDMAQMENEMNRMLDRARRLEMDAQRQADEAVQRAQQGIVEPNVQIRRSEERGINTYRYQQSITITSGPRYAYTYATPAPAMGFSPLLLVAAVIAGAYAALAAAFARNAHLTTFKDESAWRLGLMWPILLITSTRFRQQFWSAVQGKRARATTSMDGEGGPTVPPTF